MNYEEEINCRNNIMSRVRHGEKITSEDRLWLVTHRIINPTLGYPYLNTDIIHLHPKVTYVICVTVENLIYPVRIIPVITVPGGKERLLPTHCLLTIMAMYHQKNC